MGEIKLPLFLVSPVLPFNGGMDNKFLRPPILVSLKDAAALLGVCPRTVQNLVMSKQLKARKLGRRTLLCYRELEVFAQRDHPTATAPEVQ